MASLRREEFPPVQPRQQASSSFLIKNILNLPEEPSSERVSTCEENCPGTGPVQVVVPQAIRPVLFNMDAALPPMYSTQWFNAASHFPPWLLGTRFMRFLPGVTPYLRRRRNMRKRKQRPLFTQQQVQAMEQEFARHRYVSEDKRTELASALNLTETQVKTWFQNRRTKWRKEARDEMETALMESKRRWREEAEKQETPNTKQTQEFIDLDNYKFKVTQKD